MATLRRVTVRDLRNRGGDILSEVARGESFIVTRDGEPIAEIRPLQPRGVSSAELVEQWKHLPAVDPVRLRADIDAIFDTSI